MRMTADVQQLMIGGGHGSNAVLVAWAQKTMLRPRIKRAAAVAFINAFGNIAQVRLNFLLNPQFLKSILAVTCLPRKN